MKRYHESETYEVLSIAPIPPGQWEAVYETAGAWYREPVVMWAVTRRTIVSYLHTDELPGGYRRSHGTDKDGVTTYELDADDVMKVAVGLVVCETDLEPACEADNFRGYLLAGEPVPRSWQREPVAAG